MIVSKIKVEDLIGMPLREHGGPAVGMVERFAGLPLINVPQALAGIEMFPAGATVHWAFWENEVQMVLQGEAEITYTLPPNHKKVNKITVSPGHLYLILNGSRLSFKIISKEPFVHLGVMMPRYTYDRWLLKEEYEGTPLNEYVQDKGETRVD